MAKVLSGKEAAQHLTEALAERVRVLRKKGVEPCLAVIRVGEKDDDLAYERGLLKRAEKIGIIVKKYIFEEDAKDAELAAAIEEINADTGIHGALMLRPLPPHMNEDMLRNMLAPQKDVDGITDISMAGVFSGDGKGYPPCTAKACIKMLEHYHVEVSGKRAVVVGRSQVVGRPLAMLLLKKNATVTICHTRTQNMAELCREADIVIACAGAMKLLTKEFFSAGQTVLDVGIHMGEDGKMCGDVDFEAAEQIVEAISPVPGGVGAITTAVLMEHVLDAADLLSAC